MKILIATNNTHKINEFKKILSETSTIELITPKELGIVIDPDEKGTTFAENATIKSMAFYNICKIPVIADDSGLEIDILNKQPGIYSARFAGNNATDEQNRAKVLKLLQNIKLIDRNARFKCVLSFYDGENNYIFDGTIEGKIINEEKGNNGFGYDSIFLPNDFEHTFAEMNDDSKNKLSHRAKALQNFKKFYIDKYLNGRK